MTQKDSEDDDGDGTAPNRARTGPEVSRAPESERGAAEREGTAETARGSQEPPWDATLEGDSAGDVTPGNAGEPVIALTGEASAGHDEADDDLSGPVRDTDVATSNERGDRQSPTRESVIKPYRQEDAAFVSLPVRHADVFRASVSETTDASYTPVDEDRLTEAQDTSLPSGNFSDGLGDVAASVPAEADERGMPRAADAPQDDGPRPMQIETASEVAPSIADARDLDERPSIPSDAGWGNDTSAAYARGSWDKPPPLTQTPPWVWRDVEPDIVPLRGETTVAEASSEPVADEPLQAEVQTRSPELEDRGKPAAEDPEIVAEHDVQPASNAAQAPEEISLYTPLRERVAARLADPSADGEASQSIAPQPFSLSHELALPDTSGDAEPEPGDRPQTTAGDEQASTAPLAVPPPIAVPHAGGRSDYHARVEPQWERPAPQRVFQNPPDEFARDRFDVPPASDSVRYKGLGRTALRYAGFAVGGYFAFVFALILLYRVVNPPASSLMLVQALTGTEVQQQWVSLDEISPSLVRAVIVSEDWSFCEHYGIDIKAIEQAIERSGNGIPRGASTISMQTTKNLFLWNSRSYIRKVVELPLTLMIELIWPKWRILEIYLNVAEWGPGIFGAEAAAQYHFNKPAARLDSREAAQLAASLPNPIIREAGDPGPRTARKAGVIQSRMRNAGGAAECVLGGRR
ncbi:MAG: monofunctional biosynthetic peptidoglycan transglycosylase [Hyphomicrobiaceae bacterium]|nr:monofunctional biosynthetic peptidoglycan transglycosylase [Hyphomicrobiaceae bacterium]